MKAHCRRLIETIGAEGGYIMDASAIMQNDATVENLRAMTDATLEYGVYRSPSSPSGKPPPQPAAPAASLPAWATAPQAAAGRVHPVGGEAEGIAAHLRRSRLPRRVWNDIEGLAYLYIWHVLLSF